MTNKMSDVVKEGDRVLFRAGRGSSVGLIVAVDGAVARVETKSGKVVFRQLIALERLADAKKNIDAVLADASAEDVPAAPIG